MSARPLSLLFVTLFPPSPPTFGAQRRIDGLMRGLARENRVSCVSLINDDYDPRAAEEALRGYCDQVILVPSAPDRGGPWKRGRQLLSLASAHSFERSVFTSAALQRALDSILARTAFDVVTVEALHLWNHFVRQAPPGAPPPRVVLDEHNIEHDLGRQSMEASTGVRRRYQSVNWPKIRREEVSAWRGADGVTFTSHDDLARARSIFPAVRAAVIPNAVDLDHFGPGVSGADDGRTLLFFGAMDYFPNQDGMRWFMAEVWPRLLRRRPDARLKVLGRHPSAELRALQGPSIEVVGLVDDIRPHLASSAAVIVPLRVGGGTRLKVLEAMAMGKTLVSTTVGAEGIVTRPERELLIGDGPEAFAAACARLLDDGGLRRRLGAAGRALVVERYSWRAVAEELERFHRSLEEQPAAERPSRRAAVPADPLAHVEPEPDLRPTLDSALRWAGAQWWRASGRAARNRRQLYGGASGLRMIAFHGTPPGELERVKGLVTWCLERLELGTPADVDALCAGSWPHPVDRIVFTFDDGLGSNFRAAEWLARMGIPAIFFIVPSLVDRTVGEFLRYHERNGVTAFPPIRDEGSSGLSTSQVREMVDMGHRIGAHNFAHRDLGQLHTSAALRYEIDNALDDVGELTGAPCLDFALGFGQPENVSEEAAAYLLARAPRVYANHRGLNVLGRTPRILLRNSYFSNHPRAFIRACFEGSGDHLQAQRALGMAKRAGVLALATAPHVG
ncbi:MAG TPA: glycosyltransferase [Anaeromyxobacteraceae bacterium]|nr:glycosyltransferase [Anaeromyxobacteraceae bacterium]